MHNFLIGKVTKTNINNYMTGLANGTKLIWTLVIIIVILIASLCISIDSDQSDKYSKEKSQIDSLSKVISNLEKDQLKYDSLIIGYQHNLVVADQQIDSTKNKIKEIQNYYGKKIKDISRATPVELDDFFTNRYK